MVNECVVMVNKQLMQKRWKRYGRRDSVSERKIIINEKKHGRVREIRHLGRHNFSLQLMSVGSHKELSYLKR